ncbi:MAG TPA: DUF4252 domain-containing protein [Cyclobacteriaceae bacterium]|nr:DUF4252 domain-containing protein [Cyclobacteriaceae bacterium]
MRKIYLSILLLSAGFGVCAQSQTSKKLSEQYDTSLSLFFYRNTLRMLNFNDDPEFDKMINGIEKLRFITFEKEKNNFGTTAYNELVAAYLKESFEELMSVRSQDANFNVFIREAAGKTKAMLLLADTGESIMLLDMLGSVPLDKIGDLYGTVSEINGRGQRIIPKTESNQEKETDTSNDN